MGAVHRIVQRARQVGAGRLPEVPSPCVSVCRMDPDTQWCEGCFRTLDEIAAWGSMEDEGKRAVWRMIAQRALTPTLSERQKEQRKEEKA